MPSYVITEKCDGCKGQDKTACMHICPNDLMILDVERMKAYNREPEMCWECYNCVKICPTGARIWKDSRIRNISEWLSTNYYERKEPEMFI